MINFSLWTDEIPSSGYKFKSAIAKIIISGLTHGLRISVPIDASVAPI
ncbi:hypothetical protein [[Scytonema hofmanni] UTEX B 1581]|nr:hypothetical protein [[Scytonema hofmanni] UTEX B 1581]